MASSAGLAAWLLLLFVGSTFGGAIHLLLIAAAAVFPWREIKGKPTGSL